MKKLFRTIALLVLLIPCFNKTANGQAVDYSVHANIIYRFTKYMDWPQNKKSGDFIIGVLGDSPVYEELKKLTTGKKVGHQKIVVLNFSSAENISNCSILFITEDESRSLKKIVMMNSYDAILLVTEGHGLGQKGSCINLIDEDDKLKLEINKKNIEKRNMHVATELLALSTLVE